jgi:tetratricopeptide (TPR) repeat protein
MSFFTKLLGGTFESNRDEGDALLAEGRLGEAKMAYERALRKVDKAEGAAVQAVRDKIARCRLDLAHKRIAEADALAEAGEVEDARKLLKDAIEICGEPEIEAVVEERRKKYEAGIARELVSDATEMTEDELIAVIAGTWTDEQAEEYAALPDSFREAVLAGHDGDHANAVILMERALAESDTASEEKPEHYYIHLELGLAKARAGLTESAIEALGRFVDESEGDEAAAEKRVTALAALSLIHAKAERFDVAEQMLVEATRTLPANHTVWAGLGIFRRERKKFEEAIAALDKAAELMGTMRPDFSVVRELGITYLAMGKPKEAEENLFAVIEHSASLSEHEQMDPFAAIPLAKIYETKGQLDKAASLYRHLAVGHDVVHHFTYNLEAARLLGASGEKKDLIGRYLARAEELASTDEEKAAAAKRRAELGI